MLVLLSLVSFFEHDREERIEETETCSKRNCVEQRELKLESHVHR